MPSRELKGVKPKPKFNRGYFGYSADSEFLEMSYETFINYMIGEMVISIGKGTFAETARRLINQAFAWGIRNDRGS